MKFLFTVTEGKTYTIFLLKVILLKLKRKKKKILKKNAKVIRGRHRHNSVTLIFSYFQHN